MLSSERVVDFALAATIGAFAIAISPIGLHFVTGRLDLSARVNVISVIFVAFLLILAGAIVARGPARRMFFYLLAWSFPLTALAAMEAGAVTLHFADRIAPLEDMSILASKDRWPPHLMDRGRQVAKDGLLLYQPWQSDGISINELGLRTALPLPKNTKEWRIAVTGGSAAMGWRVLDADTIPVQLQEILRRQGHSNVTVYNFAMDSVTIAQELALLKRFRELYGIDHVVFYTGANDATNSYMSNAVPPDHFAGLLSGVNAFEIIKAVGRLKAVLSDPSPSLLARFDNEVLPRLAQDNSLLEGLQPASEYCGAVAIRCNFILQPLLLTRKMPRGTEIRLARALEQIYPRYRETIATIYRASLNTGLPVQNLSDAFDQSEQPYFFDAVHVNEAGNRLAAERIAAMISAGLPGF